MYTVWYTTLRLFRLYLRNMVPKNGCKPRMETNVGSLSSQDVKIKQKGASCHFLTPEIVLIVASTIRQYYLVAAFFCSPMYEYTTKLFFSTCPGAIYTRTTGIIFKLQSKCGYHSFLLNGLLLLHSLYSSTRWVAKYISERSKSHKVLP